MLRRNRILLPCALALSGLCQTANAGKAYLEPVDVPSAKLRIVLLLPETYSVHLAAFDPLACKLKGRIGWISGGRKIDQKRIGMPESVAPQEGIVERKVAALAPIAVAPSFIIPKISVMQSLMAATFPYGASADNLGSKQSSAWTAPIFTPEPDANYELVIKAMPGACEAKLFRLMADAAGKIERQEIVGPQLSFKVLGEKPACNT